MAKVDCVFIIATEDNPQNNERFSSRLKLVPVAKEAPVSILHFNKAPLTDTEFKIFGDGSSSMSAYEISKAQCHVKAWQIAKDKKFKTILVLEDSFLPTANHYHILDTDQPWDMLYLGRDSHGSDIPFESGGLVKPGFSEGSFAYVLNANGINRLVTSGFDQKLIPINDFFMSMQSLHHVKKFQNLFNGSLTALAPMKNFIQQDTNHNESPIPLTMNTVGGYTPLHPRLFDLDINNDEAWVKNYINPQLAQREYDLLCDEPIDNVYAFPLFTPLFCKEIIEEAEHFGQWTNYRQKDGVPIDIKLTSFGFDEVFSFALKKFLYPLVMHKYQLHGEGWKNLSSQNFIVRYLAENQGHLGLHNDGSYLSMIVTLNTDFDGGGTYFPKYKKLVKPDQTGYASIHPGLLGYLHGARPVTKGKRYILASFFFMGSRPFADGTY